MWYNYGGKMTIVIFYHRIYIFCSARIIDIPVSGEKHMKNVIRSLEKAIHHPKNPKTLYQTETFSSPVTIRREDDSWPAKYKGQEKDPKPMRTPLLSKFSLMGIWSWWSWHEKTINSEGAQLLWILGRTNSTKVNWLSGATSWVRIHE